MNLITEMYPYKRLVASTTQTLCTGPCALIGVRVAAVLTGQIVQVWDGSDATLAAGTIVVGTCTLAANTFHEVRALLNTGLTFQVLNDDVDLTILYQPSMRT
jgi:hypothetical protein